MISTRKLKIWIIVTHAFIILGMGHGILTLGIVEVLSLFRIPGFHFNEPDNYVIIAGLTGLIGQCLIGFSRVKKQKKTNLFMFIAGLVLLWMCIVIFNIFGNNNYGLLVNISAVPFAVCSVIAFLGNGIKKGYQWLLEKSGGGV